MGTMIQKTVGFLSETLNDENSIKKINKNRIDI